MLSVFQILLEVVTFITSLYLIISGYFGGQETTSTIPIYKRNLIFGVVLLILVLIVGIPDLYNGFTNGWNQYGNNRSIGR